jgi:hypothetical protein
MRVVAVKAVLLVSAVVLLCSANVMTGNTATGASTTPTPQATSTGPQCTFNGSALPLVTGVSPGSKIALSCSGLPPLHPYLLLGTSLVLAIDPAAAPLFSGQLVSLSGLMSLLSALPEVDLASATTPISSLSGTLDVDWTVPTFPALDPNASCPPTAQQFNSGLLGCALAMIDLTTFKPVGAGSALFEYSGSPLFPPNPTLALSTANASTNQVVSVSDAPGATSYWWLATLNVLQSALVGGSASSPTVMVNVVDSEGETVPATSHAQVTPASYMNGVFTPPVLSGNFAVPSGVAGPVTVNLTLQASLDGLPLTNSGSAPLFVGPPTTSIVIPTNGASLAGTEYLDASASGATSVEFLLFGGIYGFNAPVICEATPTIYGWLCNWNTQTVPDGPYVLVAEASNSAGSGFSSGVSITVQN